MNRRDFLFYSRTAGLAACAGRRSYGGEIAPQAKAHPDSSGEGHDYGERWVPTGVEERPPLWGPARRHSRSASGRRASRAGETAAARPPADRLSRSSTAAKGPDPVNFIAIEPIVGGRRGYSELERSAAGRKPGRVFWSGTADLPMSRPIPGCCAPQTAWKRISLTVRIPSASTTARSRS